MNSRSPLEYLRLHKVQPPQRERFQVCAAQGCDSISTLSYSTEQWQQLQKLFQPVAKNADQEREQIAQAVALMEVFNGAQNGTSHDQGRNSGMLSGDQQLDCVAESSNTTVALLLLQQRNWIRFHQPIYPYHRGFFSFQMPHYSAAIEELATGKRYAVDSWFFANGQAPVVVPAEHWKKGYDPG
ncbi:MAG: hypothetical protein OQJ91_11250 [Motiliproteus sp.]|nr:hypothetical protein [Motiliproteus sp.]